MRDFPPTEREAAALMGVSRITTARAKRVLRLGTESLQSATADGQRPAAPVTLYRGAPGRSNGRGMSWTLDVDRARWFAQRWDLTGRSGSVYKATVKPHAILAMMLGGRDEAEVVVNPRRLPRNLEVI